MVWTGIMEREKEKVKYRLKKRHVVIGDESTFEMSVIERTKGGSRMQIH